jgi:hypothetical protein
MIFRQQHDQWIPCRLHGSAAGLRAVIVGNGPSLKQEDISRLTGPGRIVIAINNAAKSVRPDWWVGMDGIENYHREIFSEPYPKLIRKEHAAQFREFPAIYCADIMDNVSFYDGEDESAFRWDKDSFRIAIQLALYLGCRDLAFLGVDLSTTGGDYADGNYLTEKQRAYNQQLYDQSFEFLRRHRQRRPDVRFLCLGSSRLQELMPSCSVSRFIKHCTAQIPAGRLKTHCTS